MAKKKKLFATTFNVYTASDIIGEGGSGRVFKVSDDEGSIYALKTLKAENISRSKIKRFRNELNFCLKNKHNNIINILDHGFTLENEIQIPFYVMPYYTHSLRDVMDQGIAYNDVIGIFHQILDGVEVAHLKDVTHRDLKPENILYDNSKNLVVVADFGIASFTDDLLLTIVETKAQERLANFQYSAPEQRQRGAEVNKTADVYALGLILNELFTTEILQGTGYRRIETVSADHNYLDEIIDKMVRQAPGDRYLTIEEIKKELNARQKAQVSLQRISKLNDTVIPTHEIDDPLIEEPIKVVGFDYQNGILILELSQNTNPKWQYALSSIGNYSYIMGKEPSQWKISGNKASISAQEHQVQQLVDHFKSYLSPADSMYQATLVHEQREKERREREALQIQLEEAERRKRILDNVKI